jgi:hypothetical protein
MSIRTISDIVQHAVIDFESVDIQQGSAFISGLTGLSHSMSVVKKLSMLLEDNGYEEAEIGYANYTVSGVWRDAENDRAFKISIRFGDTVVIQEAS